jgi:hypothetical protein
MKNALVTLCIDDLDYYKITRPYMKNYCFKHGLNFIEINKYTGISEKYNLKMNEEYFCVWEKFQILDYVEYYNQLCFVDADILINPKAENVFDYCEIGKFNACLDTSNRKAKYRVKKIFESIDMKVNLKGFKYINVGFFVIDKSFSHKLILNIDKLNNIFIKFPEQELINYNINHEDIDINLIDGTWNKIIHSSIYKKNKTDLYMGNYNFIHMVAGNKLPRIKEWISKWSKYLE